MRTSGAGGRDGFMTAVPLLMLVLFVVWMAGGPRATIALLEYGLRALFLWVNELVG